MSNQQNDAAAEWQRLLASMVASQASPGAPTANQAPSFQGCVFHTIHGDAVFANGLAPDELAALLKIKARKQG